MYGFTATVPAVINGLGYTSAQAQLLTIPIYVFAMILTLVFAWWSDKVEQRSPFIMGGYSIACIGFIAELAIPHPNLPGLTYAFLFVVAAGLYAPFICIVCIIGNNLAPSSKRAVGMALLISVGNMGGICGSNVRFTPLFHCASDILTFADLYCPRGAELQDRLWRVLGHVRVRHHRGICATSCLREG